MLFDLESYNVYTTELQRMEQDAVEPQAKVTSKVTSIVMATHIESVFP